MRWPTKASRCNDSCRVRLAAVATALPGTRKFPAMIKANMLVRIVRSQKRPAALAIERGEWSMAGFVVADVSMVGSCLEWSAVTAKADSGDQKYHADYQPDPKTRTAEKFQRIELREPIDYGDMRIFRIFHDDERILKAAGHAAPEHLSEIGSVECDFLNRADRKPR